MDERAAIGNPAFFNTFSGAGRAAPAIRAESSGACSLGLTTDALAWVERGVDRGCVAGPMDASLPRRMPVGLDLVLVMAVALKVPPGSFAGERRSQR